MKYELNNRIYLYIILMYSALLNFHGITYGITWGLPAISYPDEPETISIIINMVRNFDLNPHNFLKPSLYYYLAQVILAPYYIYHSLFDSPNFVTHVVLILRAASALFGTATVAMTYLIGKEIHGEKSGLVASSVLAVTLGFSTYAHFAYMDIPMLLLVSLTFYYSLLFLKTNKTKLLYLTCILGGLTVSTKYNSGLVVILIFIVCHLHRSIILYRKNYFSFGLFKNIFNSVFFVSGGLIGIAFFVGTPYAILDFPTFISTLIKQMSITGG
ncbi:MAG: glycosyltransferase family 39 protein [Bacteroidetes bacterium]|nr:glycosyltransferase family 39 protein [Bacteroidota bacterium]